MPDLKSQKVLAAKILKCGTSRVWLDPTRGGEIQEAITSADIRRLISSGVIAEQPKHGISSARRMKIVGQKIKGRRKGIGSHKGHGKTRMPRKRMWIKRIRALRDELRKLQPSLSKKNYRLLYRMAKAGVFRSRHHLLTHVEKEGLLKKDEEKGKEEKQK
ncbi:MAG: 50S ribosomal protein L19e [Candidatus Aenigmatarchaeota archaeon]